MYNLEHMAIISNSRLLETLDSIKTKNGSRRILRITREQRNRPKLILFQHPPPPPLPHPCLLVHSIYFILCSLLCSGRRHR